MKYFLILPVMQVKNMVNIWFLISFQFLLIFRKAAAGEISEESGLFDIYHHLSEVDVDREGVKGAANFFAAKVGGFNIGLYGLTISWQIHGTFCYWHIENL